MKNVVPKNVKKENLLCTWDKYYVLRTFTERQFNLWIHCIVFDEKTKKKYVGK
jgi:hypothetical protein